MLHRTDFLILCFFLSCLQQLRPQHVSIFVLYSQINFIIFSQASDDAQSETAIKSHCLLSFLLQPSAQMVRSMAALTNVMICVTTCSLWKTVAKTHANSTASTPTRLVIRPTSGRTEKLVCQKTCVPVSTRMVQKKR